MSRAPKVDQADPTQPQPTREDGLVVDGFGLPISGPARAAALAELGKPDPDLDPDAWGAADVRAAAKVDAAPTEETRS